MNIDEILRTSVEELARGVTPPPPDRNGVRAQARATRRRQWVAAAAGTAAVVVGGVAITNGLVDQGSAPSVDNPTPVDNLTPRPSPVVRTNESAIWSEAKALHFGSRQVPVPDQVFGFGLVEGGVVYTAYTASDRGGSKVMFQPSDGSDATEIGDNAQVTAGDPTSGLVSWVEAQGKDGSLVVFDTSTGNEVARTSVPPALRPQYTISPGTSPVISVSPTAVYYHGRDEEIWVYRWRAGGGPESTGQTRDELFDVAGGVTAQAGADQGDVEFVTPDGLVTATGLPPGGYLNPDGSLFASVTGMTPSEEKSGIRPGGIVVTDTSTGETTELDLFGPGERGFPVGVGWSSNDTLMVIGHPSEVIACTASTGKCEVVASVGSSRQGLFLTVPLS